MRKNIQLIVVALIFLNSSVFAQVLVKDIKIGGQSSNLSLVKKVGNRSNS